MAQALKAKTPPMRQCVGCRTMYEKRALIRVVRAPEGGISLDFKGKKPGRGAYLCKNSECLKIAKKKGALSRALETPIPDEVFEQLLNEMEETGANG